MLHIPFKSMAEKVEPIKYQRKWDTPQLFGQFHMSNIKSKYPVPGTAVLDDQRHKQKKHADVKRFNDKLEERKVKREGRGSIIQKKSEFAAKSYLYQILNEPINEIEGVIKESSENVSKPLPPGDTEREKKKWWKNMAKGNSNYVGYAINGGFKSFNYQDPATGDHGLHVGVRTGNLPLVRNLMVFKADSELRNRLGYFPINYCWDFWKKHNQQVLRDPQEELTYQILFTLLSYGAGVDRQDQKGNTPLHKAAQYGPLRTVLLLMGFKADVNIRNNLNQRPRDLAIKYKNTEIQKVFTMWDMIIEQMANTDFQTVWKKFIKDVEQEISAEKSAETVLFEIHMEEGMRKLDRTKDDGDFKIDDPQMRHVKERSIQDGLAKIPRPWEHGWEQWADTQRPDMDEIYGLKKKKEDPKLDLKKARRDKAAKERKEALEALKALQDGEENEDDEGDDASVSSGEIEEEDEQALLLVKQMAKAGSTVGLVRHAADRLPPREEQTARPWDRTSTGAHVDMHGKTQHSSVLDDTTGVGFFNDDDDMQDRPPPAGFHSSSTVEGDGSTTQSEGDEFRPSNSAADTVGSSAEGAVPGGDEGLFGDSLSLVSGSDNASSASRHPDSDLFFDDSRPGSAFFGNRPVSQSRARALNVGQKLLMDAKFNHFTKRPCLASAMLVPLRTANAPLENTEEEFSTVRLLSMTEAEMNARQPEKKDLLIGKKADVTVDPMGAYTSAVEFKVDNPRARLLNRVASKFANMREAAEAQVNEAKKAKEQGGGDPKRKQVDLVQQRRKRFVDSKLLPPTRHTSAFHDMKKEREEKEKAELEQSMLTMSEAVDITSSNATAQLKARNRARQQFMKGPQIPYGKTRLQSSHNLKGKIDVPWDYVGGYYNINMPI